MILLLHDLDSLLEMQLQPLTRLRLQLVHRRRQTTVVFLVQFLSLSSLHTTHNVTHTHTHTHTRPRVTHDISVSSCLFSKLAINNLTTLCHKQLDSKLYRKFFRLDHQINNTNKDIVFVYHRAQTRQAWRSLVEMAMSIRQAT